MSVIKVKSRICVTHACAARLITANLFAKVWPANALVSGQVLTALEPVSLELSLKAAEDIK